MFWKTAFQLNPIIVKELRSRMRGPRPFITITVMLILLASITYGVYRIAITTLSTYSGSPISPQIGQSLFVMLSFLLLFVICILTPAVTAGAISSEREQLTYEMLLSTPLHPAKILWGKLFSSLSYIFLLIFSAIPIASLIFVFGGVTLREMIKSFIILIVVAITLGVLGLFMSSALNRSSRAMVISYIIIAAILFGSMVIYIVAGVLQQGLPPRWLIAINPISALASALTNSSVQYNSALSFIPILGIDINTLGGSSISFDAIPRPLYHYSLPLYGFISILLYFISTRLVMPIKRWKINRKELLIFLSVVFLLCAIVLIAFLATTQNYERAVNPGGQDLSFPNAPMREPPMPQVEVAAERIPAKPVPGASSELTIENQAKIYSLAITDAVSVFEETRHIIEAKNLFLVETVLDTRGNESYTFNLPSPLKEAVSEKIHNLSDNIQWVENVEEVFENQKFSVQSSDFVINLGDIKTDDEETVSLYITINTDGVVETQTIYVLKSEDNEWKIDSIERIFDAANVD